MDVQENGAQAPVKKGGTNVALIIVIIVVGLAVLGVGGYFGVKYVLKKYVNKTTNTATTTATSAKVSVKSVEDALMYPGAKITDQEHDQNSTYKSSLILSSADSVKTIFDYYVKLASTNKYTISTQGSRDENNYYLTLTNGVFTAEIDATKYEGYDTNEIVIKISGDSLTSDGITLSPTTSATTKTATTASTSNASATSSDYVISDSSTRVIAEAELINLTPWQLKVARNEIYARHGRSFADKDLQCYFAKKSWYKVDTNFNSSILSSTENKNIATIQAYENKINSPLANSDSGCDTNQ
jgi:hypothetical protein